MSKPPRRLTIPAEKETPVSADALKRFDRLMTERVIKPMQKRAAARNAGVAKARSRPVRAGRACRST